MTTLSNRTARRKTIVSENEVALGAKKVWLMLLYRRFREEPLIMIEKIDHISIVTKDLDGMVSLFSRLFGFGVVDTFRVPEQGFRSTLIGKGDAFVELIEPLGPETPTAKFLGTKESVLHHFSLRVDSIDDESEALKSMGTRMVNDAPSKAKEGLRSNFLHPISTGGVLIELIERK